MIRDEDLGKLGSRVESNGDAQCRRICVRGGSEDWNCGHRGKWTDVRDDRRCREEREAVTENDGTSTAIGQQ